MTQTSPIGYLVPEFPNQTHAFFWRELLAIEESGVPVTVFSTRRPAPGACPHAFRDAARARTQYLFPPSGAALGFLAGRPGRLARAMRYVLGLDETPLPQRLKLLALIASAADLVRAAQAGGIGHVHIHSCANAAHLGALAHILGDLPYSLTLHGDLPVYGTDHKAKMARASFVSAVTKPLQRSLEQEVGHDQPYPVIWMGVDTDRFKPDPARRAQEADGPLEVVSVARLTFAKGHRFFLRAMARLRDEGIDIRFRMAGAGPEEDGIRAEIAELGLEDRAILIGSIGEDEVLDLLQSADALALTSIMQGEAAPVAVMEAMACGLPPVCSIIGGTPDMIADGVDGFLVPQEDVDAIAAATRKLATDPDLRHRMGEAARATAKAKFDHRSNALALYRMIRPSP